MSFQTPVHIACTLAQPFRCVLLDLQFTQNGKPIPVSTITLRHATLVAAIKGVVVLKPDRGLMELLALPYEDRLTSCLPASRLAAAAAADGAASPHLQPRRAPFTDGKVVAMRAYGAMSPLRPPQHGQSYTQARGASTPSHTRLLGPPLRVPLGAQNPNSYHPSARKSLHTISDHDGSDGNLEGRSHSLSSADDTMALSASSVEAELSPLNSRGAHVFAGVVAGWTDSTPVSAAQSAAHAVDTGASYTVQSLAAPSAYFDLPSKRDTSRLANMHG